MTENESDMKVMVAQINPCVGDLAGNLKIIEGQILIGVQNDCDVIVFPELATVGYPPRDLLYSSSFWRDHAKVIDQLEAFIKQQNKQITVIVGGLHEEMLSGGRYARYNAAWILDKHFGRRVVHKRLLPCYDIFDETRYFSSGKDEPYAPVPIRVKHEDVLCDVLICEDIWNNEYCGGEEFMKPASYVVDPVEAVAMHGKGPLFVLNGSPFHIGKIQETRRLVERICRRLCQPVIWCNQVGAHDDIVTGGYSMVSIPDGLPRTATCMLVPFQEDHFIVQLGESALDQEWGTWTVWSEVQDDSVYPLKCWGKVIEPQDFNIASVYKALFLHMTDYKRRCGFKRAVLGLSGGIDSAVVAALSVDVFGSENVTGIAMPSPFSSGGSITDAGVLADALHMCFEVKKITDAYESIKRLFLTGGKQAFDNPLTDENIQPRVRGMILMAHSNEYDPCLLLTTGNKSEITVGYCTLYGDMCGGLAVLSDLWKTQVYELARFINKYRGECIPESTITKPASAELKPDQKDTDSLPPYEELDPLLQMFVEEEMTIVEVLASERCLLSAATVISMYGKYRGSEFKRRQMPDGPRVQKRSFGSGRRIPIAMKLTTV